MTTLGQLLSSARKQKKFTIKKLSLLTKIDQRFILALEKDQYHKLPAPTFAKGFIRNLSLALDQNPDNFIAIFRRDYALPHSAVSIKNKKQFKLTLPRPQLFLLLLGLVVFLSYLGFQYRAVVTPPRLSLVQPQENQVLTSPVTVEGQTSVDSIISINFAAPFSPDQSGYFLETAVLPPGQHEVVVSVINRFNRTNTIKIPVTIISAN